MVDARLRFLAALIMGILLAPLLVAFPARADDRVVCGIKIRLTTGSDGIRDESSLIVRLGGSGGVRTGESFVFDGGFDYHSGGTGDLPDTTFTWTARLPRCVSDSALWRGFEFEHVSTVGGDIGADNWTLMGLTITDLMDDNRVYYHRPPEKGPIYRFKVNESPIWNTVFRDQGHICRVLVTVHTGADGIEDGSTEVIALGGQELIFENADSDSDLDGYRYVDSDDDGMADLPDGERRHRGGTGDITNATLNWRARFSPCLPAPLLRRGVRIQHTAGGLLGWDDWELTGLRITDLDTDAVYVSLPPGHTVHTFYNDHDQVWQGPAVLPEDPPPAPGLDTDGDGLTDLVELNGIPKGDGTLDTWLPDHGADPCRKTIAVEIDWLTVTSGPSDQPRPAALNEARHMFATAPRPAPAACPYGWPPSGGVQLLTDVSTPIVVSAEERVRPLDDPGAEADRLNCPAEAAVKSRFCLLRAANFPAWRVGFFHYSLWGFSHDGTDSSGLCCFGPRGNDIIVSVGKGWGGTAVPIYTRMQAGTFVHELGHALGLRHGGDDPVNFKPNYFSIMNYRYQSIGVPDLSAWNDVMPAALTEQDFTVDDEKQILIDFSHLDYSRAELPKIGPDRFSERAGVGAGQDMVATWWDPTLTMRAGSASGPLDWDFSGGGVPDPEATAAVNVLSKFEVCIRPRTVGGTLTTVGADGLDKRVGDQLILAGDDHICQTEATGTDLSRPRNFDYRTLGYADGIKGRDDWTTLAYCVGVANEPTCPRAAEQAPEPGIGRAESDQVAAELFDALAGLSAPTPPAAPRWGFAYVNLATVDEAPIGVETPLHPGPQWTTGAAGRLTTVTHLATGRYLVRLPGIGATRGIAHATAYRTNNRGRTCGVEDYRQDGSDELLTVRCFDEHGAPADWWSQVFFTAPVAGTASVATVRYGGSGNLDPALNSGTFNSDRQVNRVLRESTGVYRVVLTGAPFTRGTGHIQVTPYGTGNPARCAAPGTRPLAEGLEVTVTCHEIPTGLPRDSGFLLSHVDGVGLHGDTATPATYARITGDPAAPAVDAARSHSSAGETPAVSRLGLGWYRLNWAGGGKLFGNVQVTATGGSGRYCQLGTVSDYHAPPALGIDVYCSTPAGQRGDAGFGVIYTRRP